jgi:hypothetical protein
MVDVDRDFNQQSSDEMKLQSEPSESETEADNWPVWSEDENYDHIDC